MRLRLLILLSVLSLPAFAEEWNREFTVGAQPKLSVDTNDASIRVHAGGGNRIVARVTTEGYKIGPTDVRINERQTGDDVFIGVRIPSRRIMFGTNYVRVEITVPMNTVVDLRSGDGHIELTGTHGAARLHTGDGHITVREFDGPLQAHSGDGHMRIDGRFEDLQLDTSDGAIDADVRPGSKMAGRWLLHTGDGAVRLRLPESFSANLDARTGDGRIDVTLPLTINGSTGENSVRGKLNGGGQMLEIRTGDGAVRVSRY